jgi:hypothetical protein
MNDDEWGTLMLRPLVTEPAGPPRLDVPRAMREGRRRRRGWWAGGSLAALVAAVGTAIAVPVLTADKPTKPSVLLPPDPVMPASCTVEQLPLGQHTSADVAGVDPSGRWMVGVSDPSYGGPQSAVLVWRDGELVTDLVPKKTGAAVTMSAINGSGVAVGGTNQSPGVPYVVDGRTVTRLKGGAGRATSINEAGVISGTLVKDGRWVAARWTSPDAEPALWPLPQDPKQTLVHALAADGTIAVGDVLWRPDGRTEKLRLPRVEEGRPLFSATTFRDGWLYGALSVLRDNRSYTDGEPYRYDPVTATWQKLDRTTFAAQLVGNSIFVRSQLGMLDATGPFTLPPHPTTLPDDWYLVTTVSQDVRVIGGHTLSRSASEHDDRPLRWLCQ